MNGLQAADRLAVLAARLRLESRHDFWRVSRREDGVWSVETTSEALGRETTAGWDGAAGPVHVRLLPAAPAGATTAWVAASVAEVRREPRHAAEQITQALQGECVTPLLHEDGWLLGRLPDGYIGWIRDWHLALTPAETAAAFARRTTARVGVPCWFVRAEPHRDAASVADTILGTAVVVHATSRGWAEVELPAGRRGWVPETVLRDGTAPWPLALASLFAMTRGFLGVPYQWGGRSPKGFDCSGLTQFVYGVHGVPLPRDSDEQARAGTAVDGDPRPGDLVFFGRERVTHVGIATGAGEFLHARGHVRCNSLAAGTPHHDAELRALWCGTRRFLPPSTPEFPG